MTIWDVGTRAPSKLIADVIRAVRERHVAGGSLAFLSGLALTIAAQLLLDRALESVDLVAVRLGLEAWTICSALLIEMLAGPPLRVLVRFQGGNRA